jgi:EAL and modified HD-GYP domain-containing signal transduction protein
LFTVGLFSVVDALLDAPIEHVLASLPFPEDMRRALILHEGRMGRLLECVTALEAGAFRRADEIVPDSWQLYLDALEWTNHASRELLDAGEARAA